MYSKSGIDLNVCAYCSESIDQFSKTVDHLNPESRGGKLSNRNKVPSCVKCNGIKGDMNLDEFERSVGGMLRLESRSYKSKKSYLKRILYNITKIKEWRDNQD